jgi:hypothetical protein
MSRAAAGLALAFLVLPAAASDADFAYSRAYVPGEVSRYDIERRAYQDELLTSHAQAVSVHSVPFGSPLREFIRIEKLVRAADQDRVDLTEQAAGFAGMLVSVASNTEKAAPGLERPPRQGLETTLGSVVADLHACLLAVSPRSGVGRLRRVGDAYVSPSRRATSRGCAQVRTELTELSGTEAVIKTTFSPPDAPCLTLKKPELELPLDASGPPSNYQLVAGEGGRFSVRWGRDQTVVSATLDRRTGTLLGAELEGVRVLRERAGCSPSLEHCAPASSLLLRRTFKMTLRRPPPWQRR